MAVSSEPTTIAAASDPLLLRATQFREHLDFTAAIRAYIEHASGFRRTNAIANKLVSHHARWRVAGFLFYLNADKEKFGPEGGATYSRLNEMCARRPAISPRTLKTMLALLQLTSMVVTKRSCDDGRSKVYVPSQRMRVFLEPWLNYATKTLDILEPQIGRAAALANDPSFVDRFMVSMGRAHGSAVPLVERMPEYTAFFGGRDGATAVLLAIMSAHIDGRTIASRADLGKAYGVTKTQVTKILSLGEQRGYFAIDTAGSPSPTAFLLKSFRNWVAIELAFYAEHMRP